MTVPPAPPGSDRPVRIHSLGEACVAVAAAEALGVPLVLVSAPAAAAHGGPLWWLETVKAARPADGTVAVTAVLDCADRAGDAQAAIAAGVSHLLFTGRSDVADRLAAIGATIILRHLPPALDLRPARDPTAACHAWLTPPGS